MAPSHPPHRRLKQITISKPIIYGNYATKFSPVNPRPLAAPTQHTHSWTIFVRDPTGNDLSTYIKKVVFKLHDTYPNPTRTIENPPFEVTESGWGEFEVLIKIFFHTEGGEKNVNLTHYIRLHPYNGEEISMDGKVESISYDEIVFNEPTDTMFSLLTKQPGTLLSDDLKKREREELDRIGKAMDTINAKALESETEFINLQKEREKLMEL